MAKLVIGVINHDVYGDGQQFQRCFAIFLKINDQYFDLWETDIGIDDRGDYIIDEDKNELFNGIYNKASFFKRELNLAVEVSKEAIELEMDTFETNLLETTWA